MTIDTSKLKFDIEGFLNDRELCPELEAANRMLIKEGQKMIENYKREQAKDWYRIANLTVGVNG